MAKPTLSLGVLLLVLLLSLNSGGLPKLANAQLMQNTWCVAKPSSSDAELRANIDFACNNLEDCSLIQEGGACSFPDTLMNHASVVMNLYYKNMGQNFWNCNFSNSALISQTDPSHDSCIYA